MTLRTLQCNEYGWFRPLSQAYQPRPLIRKGKTQKGFRGAICSLSYYPSWPLGSISELNGQMGGLGLDSSQASKTNGTSLWDHHLLHHLLIHTHPHFGTDRHPTIASPMGFKKKKKGNSIYLQDRIVVLQNPPGDFPSWGNIHLVSSLSEPSAVPAPSQLTLCRQELCFPRSWEGNGRGPPPPRLLARRPLSLVQKVSLPVSSPLSPHPKTYKVGRLDLAVCL